MVNFFKSLKIRLFQKQAISMNAAENSVLLSCLENLN